MIKVQIRGVLLLSMCNMIELIEFRYTGSGNEYSGYRYSIFILLCFEGVWIYGVSVFVRLMETCLDMIWVIL